MTKSFVKNIIKFAIVVAIFVYLYKNGHFEPAKLKKAFERIDLLMAAVLLVLLSCFLQVERWRYLLYTQNIFIGHWQAQKLTFIGYFFSTAIPGAVSGDIVKAYYVSRGQKQKAVLITSVLFDRILGMYTMVLVAAMAILYSMIREGISGHSGVWSQPYFKGLGAFIIGLFIVLTISGKLFMSRNLRRSSFVERTILKIPFHKTIIKIYDAVYNYGKKPGMTLVAMLLSILVQLPLYAGMWCIAVILDIKLLNFLDYFIVLPVGLLINAIPLAPGGLGVGEVGFGKMFLLFGANNGAELAFIFHAIFFIMAIGLGGLVYLFSDVSRENKKIHFL